MTGVYLDYNGSSPLDPHVLEAMKEALTSGAGNASASHRPGQQQAARVDHARAQVAALVGARSAGVVFTSGATESNNLALKGLALATSPERNRIVISGAEHHSVSNTAMWLAEASLCKVDVAPITADGFVDLEALAPMLGPDVLALSVVGANSETGVINDLQAVAALARDCGALVHCDATQLVGRVPVDLGEFGADLVSISGHKMCGPTGVGALIGTGKTLDKLVPTAHGGGQERGLRSGSLNVAGVVGLGAACELTQDLMADETTRFADLRDQLVEGLKSRLDGVSENGDTARRLPNTANLRLAGADAEAVVVNADPVAISAGSACHFGAIEPSPVLTAMGLDRTSADECIRISVGRFTTQEEVDSAIERLVEAANRVRRMQRTRC